MLKNHISGNTELLRVAEAVANEKGVSFESIIIAIEEGLKMAAKKKYGNEYDINAQIDRKTGEFRIYKRLEIVADIEEPQTQILLEDVDKTALGEQEAQIGDFITQKLPPLDLKRLLAIVVKNIINQKVKVAEKEKEYEKFKDKAGTIINGVVKKISNRGVLLDISGYEAFLHKNDSIPSEALRQNERVRAVIKDVVREDSGVQIFLSRSSNDFMKQLFTQEVPEIYDGVIKIQSVAREAGMRAKIAVKSTESNLDPVGACVGVRGSRVQVIINELKGEKIDIIEWSSDVATFVVNSLRPAQILKVIIDEEAKRIEAVVPQKDLSIAIGRKGQNARLVSRLTGWRINILTEDKESENRKEEETRIFSLFVDDLKLDEISTRVLFSEGVSEAEDLAEIDPEDLAGVESFTLEKATNLIKNAKKFIKSKKYQELKWDKYSLNKDLLQLKNIDLTIAIKLNDKKIDSLEKIADLSRDDFKDIISDDNIIADDEINQLIMSARDIVFK